MPACLAGYQAFVGNGPEGWLNRVDGKARQMLVDVRMSQGVAKAGAERSRRAPCQVAAKAAMTSLRPNTASSTLGSSLQRPQAARRSSRYCAAAVATSTWVRCSTRSAQRVAARRTGSTQSFSRHANAAKKKDEIGGVLMASRAAS